MNRKPTRTADAKGFEPNICAYTEMLRTKNFATIFQLCINEYVAKKKAYEFIKQSGLTAKFFNS